MIVKIVKVKNLTANSNYSIKIELELYSLSLNSGSNILQSDDFNFKTGKGKKAITKNDESIF